MPAWPRPVASRQVLLLPLPLLLPPQGLAA